MSRHRRLLHLTLAGLVCGWLPPELRHPDYRMTAPDSAPRRRTGKDAAAEQSGDVV